MGWFLNAPCVSTLLPIGIGRRFFKNLCGFCLLSKGPHPPGKKANGYSGVSPPSMDSKTDKAAQLEHRLPQFSVGPTAPLTECEVRAWHFPEEACRGPSPALSQPHPLAPLFLWRWWCLKMTLMPCLLFSSGPCPRTPHPSSLPRRPHLLLPVTFKIFFFFFSGAAVTLPVHTEVGAQAPGGSSVPSLRRKGVSGRGSWGTSSCTPGTAGGTSHMHTHTHVHTHVFTPTAITQVAEESVGDTKT